MIERFNWPKLRYDEVAIEGFRMTVEELSRGKTTIIQSTHKKKRLIVLNIPVMAKKFLPTLKIIIGEWCWRKTGKNLSQRTSLFLTHMTKGG
jgi:hypothetical protein